jgi:hypothetical protein
MTEIWACPQCIRRGFGDPGLWRTPHCTECGAKMVKVECPKCHAPLSPATKKFCMNCGEGVEELRTKFDPLFLKPAATDLPALLGAAAAPKSIDDVIPPKAPVEKPAKERPPKKKDKKAPPEPAERDIDLFSQGVEERNY